MTVYPQRKSPTLAAVINFIFWGLGYYYLGIKSVFGIPWLGLLVLEIVLTVLTLGSIQTYSFWYYTYYYYTTVTWLCLIVSLIIGIAVAADAYKKCQAINLGAFPVGYQAPPAIPTGYQPQTYPLPQYMPQAPVPPRPATTQPPSAYCGQCGAPMRPDILYCTNCGAKRA